MKSPSALRPAIGARAAIFLSVWLTFLVAGCGSTKPASASFASVVIRGFNAEEITKATVAVFQEDGYSVRAVDGRLIFDKEASRMTNVAYEGLVGSHYGAQTLVRVKASGIGIRTILSALGRRFLFQ